jgi:RNA polymerase sigma factor (sigma-70 family)
VPAAAPLSDGQFLHSFLSRHDEAAFEVLVRRHGPMVLQVARRVLQDGDAAEDVFQATFLVLSRRAASICKQESVGCWLHGVAHRLAQKARADAARRHSHETRAAHRPPTDPLAQVTWQELQSVLDDEIGRLPAGCSGTRSKGG